MMMSASISDLAERLRSSSGVAAKRAIGSVAGQLALANVGLADVGDDCAAIPDGDGYLLFAIEGFLSEFVSGDPWFAGWCGIMVNVADIAAMGGRPIAVVDCVLGNGEDRVDPILVGLKAASETFNVPVVGGHTCTSSGDRQLSVAIIGRAKKLLTSFDAKPGERLIAAIDLRGRYREPYSNWEAATDAPAARLRASFELLPKIAEAGLSRAAKDISQAGVIGTAMMLAECSGCGVTIDLDSVPKPAGVALERWLQSFPSFGFILSVAPAAAPQVIAEFAQLGIAAADIGCVTRGSTVEIASASGRETVWDFAASPLMGLSRPRAPT